MNLVSILVLRLFSTVSILLSSSVLTDLISACKRASTFSSFISKFSFKNSISL
ncbi:hypothetical protein bpSLO_001465 (plasmid) [Borrelia parkeri]|nr:hypothetical protein bpSLO_001349 [Borrelia parkeri]UPA11562.1 hypothetical protein bpSLO_001423 [Borrelia parkeri]UPA11600.1 hypothetical protein bpSLO_001465 [Borrelia parkeri]